MCASPSRSTCLTCFIGATHLLIYNLVYTPLKRVTWMNTLVGGGSRRPPTRDGWTAARSDPVGEGWLLFAILFFWQYPHFPRDCLAVSRRITSGRDSSCCRQVTRTARAPAGGVVAHRACGSSGVAPVGCVPGGSVYLAVALLLGAMMLWASWRFRRELDGPGAALAVFWRRSPICRCCWGRWALNKLVV